MKKIFLHSRLSHFSRLIFIKIVLVLLMLPLANNGYAQSQLSASKTPECISSISKLISEDNLRIVAGQLVQTNLATNSSNNNLQNLSNASSSKTIISPVALSEHTASPSINIPKGLTNSSINSSVEALAQNAIPIGRVVWVKGLLKATQPEKEERVLTRRSPIFENDTLITEKNSSGQIVFSDESLLSLRENTELQIQNYQYGKGIRADKESFAIHLIKGGFRTITGAIPKENPSGYKATTPVATIAVRGTEYSVYYTPNSKKGMATKLDKGSIEISNAAGKITLKKCSKAELKEGTCHEQIYSEVKSAKDAPIIVNQMPAEFVNDVNLISSTWTNNSNGTKFNNGGEVSGFCIQ